MPNLRNNGQSRPSATSAYVPTQSSTRPIPGNIALAPVPLSATSPTTSSHRKKHDHVKRPMNPFMLFRKHVYDNRLISEKYQNNLSEAVAKMWNALSEEEKAPWKVEAERVKQEHMERYPGYTFTPGKKMSPSEAMVVKPESERASKARVAVRAGASATGRSKPPTTMGHSSPARTSTREVTPAIVAPVATRPFPTPDHLEVFSDDDNDGLDSDPMPITPNLAEHDAFRPMLYPNDPMHEMDLNVTDRALLAPTSSHGLDESLDQQLAKLNASTDVSWFPVSTPQEDLYEQAPLDSDSSEERRKMLAEYVVGYNL